MFNSRTGHWLGTFTEGASSCSWVTVARMGTLGTNIIHFHYTWATHTNTSFCYTVKCMHWGWWHCCNELIIFISEPLHLVSVIIEIILSVWLRVATPCSTEEERGPVAFTAVALCSEVQRIVVKQVIRTFPSLVEWGVATWDCWVSVVELPIKLRVNVHPDRQAKVSEHIRSTSLNRCTHMWFSLFGAKELWISLARWMQMLGIFRMGWSMCTNLCTNPVSACEREEGRGNVKWYKVKWYKGKREKNLTTTTFNQRLLCRSTKSSDG